MCGQLNMVLSKVKWGMMGEGHGQNTLAVNDTSLLDPFCNPSGYGSLPGPGATNTTVHTKHCERDNRL